MCALIVSESHGVASLVDVGDCVSAVADCSASTSVFFSLRCLSTDIIGVFESLRYVCVRDHIEQYVIVCK